MRENPMQSLCGAHCRTTGKPCQNYQMPNGRCRMHGGKSTGRPTTHGQYTAKALSFRAKMVQINREVRELTKQLKS
jgi:hypothetical protein